MSILTLDCLKRIVPGPINVEAATGVQDDLMNKSPEQQLSKTYMRLESPFVVLRGGIGGGLKEVEEAGDSEGSGSVLLSPFSIRRSEIWKDPNSVS